MPVCLLRAPAWVGEYSAAMRTTALIHLTGLMQPASGTGGTRGRGHRELVRESLRAVPGHAGATHRRWS